MDRCNVGAGDCQGVGIGYLVLLSFPMFLRFFFRRGIRGVVN